MSTTLLIVTVLLGISFIGAASFYFRSTLKLLYLMTRATPYTQTIPGAPRILVLGDSTGYGTGTYNPARTVAGRIGSQFSVTIENDSVNGRTIGDLTSKATLCTGRYELILLQIGGNDILDKRDVAMVENELRALVKTLVGHTDHLLMIAAGNVGASPYYTGATAAYYEQASREFRAMFLRVASETDLTYVDLFEEPENDAIVQNPDTYVSVDGLHPNETGYKEWYNALLPVIEPILKTHKINTP